MSSEITMILEIWEAVRDYIPAARRTEAATTILNSVIEYGFELRDIADVGDEDNNLEAALEMIGSENEEHSFGEEGDFD